MRLLMNDGDFKPSNYDLMSAMAKHFLVVTQQWADMAGLAQDGHCIHSVKKKHRIINVMCDNLYSTLNTYKGN